MSRNAAVAAQQLVHPTARFERQGLTRLVVGGVFLGAMLVALAVLLHFHDRFWWAPGEGAAASIAERVLAGGASVGTPHGIPSSYVHWVNALAFQVFGTDLLSLRYPLLALTLIQAALAFWLLAGRGVLIAFAAAMAMSCLTFVQFLNPAAQWYALFLCLVVVVVMSDSQGERRGSLEIIGVLLATLFLFQPLSGILAAMGVLTFLLVQEQRHPGNERAILARGLAVVMFAGLALFLRATVDIFTAVLLGAPPLSLLGYAVMATRLSNRCLGRLMRRLGLGGLLGFAPLLAYHVAQGSLTGWGQDMLAALSAPTVLGLAEARGFAGLARQAVEQLYGNGGPALLNGLFWLVLLLLPAALGVLLLRSLWRGEEAGRAALPVFACFFALASASLQAPVSLFFTAALTLAAVLFVAAAPGRRRGFALAAAGVALSLIGLTYQAGQPLSRGWEGTVAGRTKTVVAPIGLPRASLTVAAEEAALYGLLANLIERHSADTDPILALPANPELYFLAERDSALGLLDAGQSLSTETALRVAEASLSKAPPRLLIYRPGGVNDTPQVRRLMSGLRGRYRLLETAGDFEIYLLNQ